MPKNIYFADVLTTTSIGNPTRIVASFAAVAATGGPGGPWPPHFLLR